MRTPLWWRKVYWKVCLVGSHILHDGMFYRWTCLAGVHVVWVDMYYWRHAQLMDSCTGWHVMQVDMYYWKICGSGCHVYHENICYGRTCPVGGHFLHVCAEATTIEAAVSLGSWCVLFSPVFYFFPLRYAFQRFIVWNVLLGNVDLFCGLLVLLFFFLLLFLKTQLSSCMLDKHIPSTAVFKIVVWVCQTMMMGGSVVIIHH